VDFFTRLARSQQHSERLNGGMDIGMRRAASVAHAAANATALVE
jgi:hypothetical protein